MPLHPTCCPLDCPDACGALIETDDHGQFLRLRGNPEHPWSRGHLCGKTAIYHEVALGANRLRHPLVRKGGELKEASWDEALDCIAQGVGDLAGEEQLALSYAGSMGLLARNAPMRLMNALGATCTDGSICDTTSTLGHQLVLGDAVGPDLEEVVHADVLVLWGCDAARTVQHLMPRVKEVLSAGGQVVVIDVYRSDTLRRVEAWGGNGIVVAPGSDASLALGLCEWAFERQHADWAYLDRECTGAGEFQAALSGTYGLERVARDTGLEPAEIVGLGELLAQAKCAWIKTGIGWNRRRNGGDAMRAVCSLAAVMGIADRLHFESGAIFGLDTDFLSQPWRRPSSSRDPIRHIELGGELETGRFKAAYVWGHNPAVVVPDSRRVRSGLARHDLFLVVHELVMTETARLADVVLPACALPEYTDVFKSYGHRVVQLSQKVCQAPAEQRSNVDTFAAIAMRLGLECGLHEGGEEALLDDFLEAHRSRFSSEQFASIRAGRPTKLSPRLGAQRGTPSGLIELASERAQADGQGRVPSYVPDDGSGLQGRFWLHPTPSVATHNSTYTHSVRHVRRGGPARVLVHPEDAAELGLDSGQQVQVSNVLGTLILELALCSHGPPGMLRVEGFADPAVMPEGLSINALTAPAPSHLGAGFCQYSTRADLRGL